MTENNNITNQTEAKLHLLKKCKYDLAIDMNSKLVKQLTRGRDMVLFRVNGEQTSVPAALVKTFTNINSNNVTLDSKYNIHEVNSLFEILQNPMPMRRSYSRLSGLETSKQSSEHDGVSSEIRYARSRDISCQINAVIHISKQKCL